MKETEKAEVFNTSCASLLSFQKTFRMISTISLNKRREVQAKRGIEQGI